MTHEQSSCSPGRKHGASSAVALASSTGSSGTAKVTGALRGLSIDHPDTHGSLKCRIDLDTDGALAAAAAHIVSGGGIKLAQAAAAIARSAANESSRERGRLAPPPPRPDPETAGETRANTPTRGDGERIVLEPSVAIATTHVRFHTMGVSKFVMDAAAQELLQRIQEGLVDAPYTQFGKTEGSWERGYNIVFPSSFGSDRRKPVTAAFQEHCDSVYCPVVYTLLFGSRGWREICAHLSSFKSNTIKVCEEGGIGVFHGRNVFHMHLDGKIGKLQPKNQTQKHASRLLFSIVPAALREYRAAKAKVQPGPGYAAAAAAAAAAATAAGPSHDQSYSYGCTVYPTWQLREGFANNHEFHRYMESAYHERALSKGLPRPLYEIPEEAVYRSKTGEVLIHKSHADATGPQPIHAEANPCPDRYLFVFDFKNLMNHDEHGKVMPSTEIPEATILKHMRVLADSTSIAFAERLEEVAQVARDLLCHAASSLPHTYPGKCATIEETLRACCKLPDAHESCFLAA